MTLTIPKPVFPLFWKVTIGRLASAVKPFADQANAVSWISKFHAAVTGSAGGEAVRTVASGMP